MEKVGPRTGPSLASAVYGFVLIGAALAAIGSWLVIYDRLDVFREAALAEAVTKRAQGIELDFARTLHQEWQSARIIAEDIAQRDRQSIRSSLDLIVGDNSRVSWAGIAQTEGSVSVASGGLLEGQDVSSRPWFQRGLEGDFAGDVHEAVLLAELLPSEGGEPRRFLDFATPIRNASDAVNGVLGLHLDHGWAEEHLRTSAQSLGLDIFIIDRSGRIVLASTDEFNELILDLPSMRAASAGASLTSIEEWPDGVSYLTSVIPSVSYADLPSFGWRMVARIDNDAVAAPSFSTSLLFALAAFGLVLAVMAYLFVQIFARPFRKLSESAQSILHGNDIYPYESRSTREAITLSAAIARLQGKNYSG